MRVYPACHDRVMSVSAVSESGLRWGSSNWGKQTEFSAPGANVLSTYASTGGVNILSTGFTYAAEMVAGSPKQSLTGKLKLCAATDTKCKTYNGNHVCFFEKPQNMKVDALAAKCKLGNGAGMVLYWGGGARPTSWSSSTKDFPVVVVSRAAAEELTANYNKEKVTIGDVGGDSVEYSYEVLSGTSMAAPHVTAAAAILWSHHPTCTNHQIRYALAVKAQHPEGRGVCDDKMGYGVIKVKESLDWLNSVGPCKKWTVSQESEGGCSPPRGGAPRAAGGDGAAGPGDAWRGQEWRAVVVPLAPRGGHPVRADWEHV